MPKTVKEKVQEVFGQLDDNEELLAKYTEDIVDSWKTVEHKFRRMLSLLFIFWAAFYLIGSGLVLEGAFGGLKIAKIQTLLITAPIVIGVVSYLMLGALAMVAYYKNLVSECYKILNPKLVKESMHLLLAPPTFLTIESILRNESRSKMLGSIHEAWLSILILSFLVIPVVALAHCGYLMWQFSGVTMYGQLASIILGFSFLATGALNIITSFGVTD